MNKVKKYMATFLCIIVLILQASPVYASSETEKAYNINKAYEYPITPDNEKEWAKLTTLEEKLEVCQIPDELLKTMSTSALIETVANYPLSVNLYAFDTIELGYQMIKNSFNGVAELEKRMQNTPMSVKAAFLNEILSSSKSNLIQNIDDNTNPYFILRIKECIENSVNIDVMQPTISKQYATTYITTPKGSKVTAIKDCTWNEHGYTQSECEKQHNLVKKQYPSVTIISGISPKYNCHSYAWYSTSTGNRYWINNPSAYITDGSYKKASVYILNSKLTYTYSGEIIHSGIISGVSDKHLTYVTSKWGSLGVYKHLYFDCPYSQGKYSSSSVSSYVKN
ncbi:hypothetical protein [uncultured Eubacterium sp.]|uniref:hypothetical protein n=1 Tax=uncultured Eubacterium sp. TaxID=165185 RepID=UPI00258CC9F9|nr:hypothetical protein [uncultured Eubacterium sp.]